MSAALEARIDQWRVAVLRGRTVDAADADELESHLREQIADLETAGLSDDEAFLIAVRRLGAADRLTAEFAREHGDRLWKQLTVAPVEEGPRRQLLVMLGFAAVAAVLIQVGRLTAEASGPSTGWILRDASLFVLPVLIAYFAVLRRMPWRRIVALAGTVVLLAAIANVFPFVLGGSTEVLVAIHLPVALWLVVGAAYLGGDIRSSNRRMDFVRFSGEWAIYFTLIALGGAVLLGLTAAVLTPIAPDAMQPILTWVLPSGAAAAVIVAAWLVEAKKSIIENLAPVLTAIFTPLFAVMLLGSALAYAITGLGRDFDRDLLTVFDVLLLVVVALVVYGISARDATRGAGAMDVIRLVAVVAAIVLDLLVLVAMLARVGELGFTPNRLVALGLNVILLVNLLGTAWLTLRLLTGHGQAVRIERWQTEYLAAFAVWVAFVLVAVPPIFGFA
ncbi:permease prefix domain 1-containing protein [Leifsonia sp. H3M29-4]|uniref:permease prefix domain 1-containing protein n=1 Tax=Salinibacterium metalliresistens TaxID=3031321 RepID=UPI0023DBCAFC|nr:permease prefix domain 1-containing protein [Salinibacterium metalliresistens]MDF1479598.1 permease prefix domain 1-containing protein [Salinibacterium metalliresistens]